METTTFRDLGFRVLGLYGLYWGYPGLMEKKMETITFRDLGCRV